MNDKIETMIVNLREAAVMGRDIDIFETLGLCTLGIICGNNILTLVQLFSLLWFLPYLLYTLI